MRFAPLLLLAASCASVTPPANVDRATVLEEEAGGSYEELEHELARAEVAPHPVPLTPAQLEALGIAPPPLLDHTTLTDADAADELLAEHCIGEGKDGLLADTHDACHQPMDRNEVDRLADRINRARVQLWHWMEEERPNASPGRVRRAWREAHVQGVVCGGWIEREDGTWEAKKC